MPAIADASSGVPSASAANRRGRLAVVIGVVPHDSRRGRAGRLELDGLLHRLGHVDRGLLPVARGPAERTSGDALEIASANEESVASMPIEEDDRSALRELAACLQPMLRQLAPAYQDAIRMADLDGLTHVEAARRAGVSVSGMKSRVQRARQQLRAIVEECCRVDFDRRGSITSFASRRSEQCTCGDCK